jgi:hypothetical protein
MTGGHVSATKCPIPGLSFCQLLNLLNADGETKTLSDRRADCGAESVRLRGITTPDYESGGQEFESLRARQKRLHLQVVTLSIEDRAATCKSVSAPCPQNARTSDFRARRHGAALKNASTGAAWPWRHLAGGLSGETGRCG